MDRSQRSQSNQAHPFNKPNEPTIRETQSNEQRELEEEIRQLENQLKEVTHNSQFSSPMDDRSARPTRILDDLHGQSAAGNDRSSVISVNTSSVPFASFSRPPFLYIFLLKVYITFLRSILCVVLSDSDDRALSRVLGDLSNQVADLKSALKEVSRERDALRRFRVRIKNPRSSASTSSSETDPVSNPFPSPFFIRSHTHRFADRLSTTLLFRLKAHVDPRRHGHWQVLWNDRDSNVPGKHLSLSLQLFGFFSCLLALSPKK
jgi:hypothetical protein